MQHGSSPVAWHAVFTVLIKLQPLANWIELDPCTKVPVRLVAELLKTSLTLGDRMICNALHMHLVTSGIWQCKVYHAAASMYVPPTVDSFAGYNCASMGLYMRGEERYCGGRRCRAFHNLLHLGKMQQDLLTTPHSCSTTRTACQAVTQVIHTAGTTMQCKSHWQLLQMTAQVLLSIRPPGCVALLPCL